MFSLLENRLGLVSALMLSIGCSAPISRPPLPASGASPAAVTRFPDSNAPATWMDSIEATEVAGMKAADGKVSRAGSELRIQLLDGRTATFKDDTTSGMQRALPRYAGYLREIHSHVIHEILYEGSGSYLMVDDSTGDSTIVFGMPVVSRDGRRFALTSMADGGSYDPSLIEVWRMDGRKLERELSYDSENEPWEPSDPVWRDSATIDFTRNSHEDPSEPWIKKPGRLIRIGTTWSLTALRH